MYAGSDFSLLGPHLDKLEEAREGLSYTLDAGATAIETVLILLICFILFQNIENSLWIFLRISF